MGVLGYLKKIFGEKEKEEGNLSALQKLGIYIFSDERMKQRILLVSRFYNAIKRFEKLRIDLARGENPIKILDKMAALLNEMAEYDACIAIPYWRAKDREKEKFIMECFSGCVRILEDWILLLRNWFIDIENERARYMPSISKRVLAEALHCFIEKEQIPIFEAILYSSWSEKDITPSYIGEIYAPPQQMGSQGGLKPTSQLGVNPEIQKPPRERIPPFVGRNPNEEE